MSETSTFAALIDRGILEIGDGYRAKLDELGGDGPLFLRAVSVSDGSIQYGGDRFQSELRDRLRAKMGRGGDVVITTKGASTGRTAFVRSDAPEFVYSPHLSFWRSRSHSKLVPAYLRYWARSSACKLQIDAMAASTDMSLYLSLIDQRRIRIALPPIDVQHTIAGVLGALDDKIELNRRINETLDDLSVSLFLEFLRRISSDGATVRLGDELTTLLGGTPSRSQSEYWSDGTVAWINSGKTNEFRIVEPSAHITEDALASSAAKLLPARTTVIAITGATLGQVSLTEIETAANQSVVGVIGSDRLPSEYVYLWFRTRIQDLVARQTGGAQQHINRGDVDDFEIMMPPSGAMNEWIAVVRPLFDQIRINSLQSRTLAELRDALLPKLISGELRVRDAEPTVECAV